MFKPFPCVFTNEEGDLVIFLAIQDPIPGMTAERTEPLFTEEEVSR